MGDTDVTSNATDMIAQGPNWFFKNFLRKSTVYDLGVHAMKSRTLRGVER